MAAPSVNTLTKNSELITADSDVLLDCLTSSDELRQELALCVLMRRVKSEGLAQARKECDEPASVEEKAKHGPGGLFSKLITRILQPSVNMTKLGKRFQEFLEYDDVRYYLMKHMLTNLKGPAAKAIKLENVYILLDNLNMPNDPGAEKSLSNFLVKSKGENATKDQSSTTKAASYQEQKKSFTWLWLEFLKRPLTRSLYKTVLVRVHDKVMPFMTNPLQLSDFLAQSFEQGGVVSLLALNGLFVLVNQFNLNCPNFYEKLYALLKTEIFFVKFRARFFYLLDLFLTSSHLPAYLVAAFTKKLCRLSLQAPPDALTSVIPLVYNLITRHPNCKTLLHLPVSATHTSLSSDPFDENEPDPAKSRALESSLWELRTLEDHYYSSVASEARKCQQLLPNNESDISELLEISVDDLVEKETRKKLKKVPTTFDVPKGLISSSDKVVNKLWML